MLRFLTAAKQGLFGSGMELKESQETFVQSEEAWDMIFSLLHMYI